MGTDDWKYRKFEPIYEVFFADDMFEYSDEHLCCVRRTTLHVQSTYLHGIHKGLKLRSVKAGREILCHCWLL